MYHIKPVSAVPTDIDLPKCMYNIKPLNGVQIEGISSKRVKMEPELQVIEDRQLAVISRLRQLRDTVDDLIRKSGGPQAAAVKESPVQSRVSGGVTCASSSGAISASFPSELVVEANPNRPPLSLLFFNKIAPSLQSVCHTHSSCAAKVDPKLTSLFSKDSGAPSNSTLRVVWKNVQGSRLTPPTLGSYGVEGESNVARFLSRALAKPDDTGLNYDALSLEDLVLVDGVLESSDLVDTAPEQFLNSLQAYVQRRGSSGRTIADFVGYSTLRYLTKQQPSRSVQKSLIDWMNGLTNDVPSV